MAGFGQGTQNSVGKMDRRRHQDVGLGAGIAEHQPLVAGAFVLVARGVYPLGDIGRLVMDVDFNVRVFPVKAVLFVADFPYAGPGDFFQDVMGDPIGTPDFAGKDDLVGGAKGFHRDTGKRIGGKVFIDHGVGNPVADFIRVTFRD